MQSNLLEHIHVLLRDSLSPYPNTIALSKVPYKIGTSLAFDYRDLLVRLSSIAVSSHSAPRSRRAYYPNWMPFVIIIETQSGTVMVKLAALEYICRVE